MGLDPRGRGRGRGRRGVPDFQAKGQGVVGMIGQTQNFKTLPPGMFCSPVGFLPQPPFGGTSNFGGSSGCNYGPLRLPFVKAPRNNSKKHLPYRNNYTTAIEIDLTKPWVNEEMKNEETKKQELLEIWRKTKNDEDWSKYKVQKQTIQSMYDKAKTEYASDHSDQALLWENNSRIRNYYCETCDKSFRTDDDLYLHEAEHQTCGRDGCEFTAHPKIIAKHIKMQHFSGLYQRIGKLYSQEDIAKWIEERKKRYPTKKVVEEKKLLEKEKLSRGEKIKDSDSKFNKLFNNKNYNRKKFEKKTRKNTSRRTKKKKNTSVVEICTEEEKCDIRKGVPAFSGINDDDKRKIPEKTDLCISDEEWETECKPQTLAKPALNNSLGLLAAFYESEEESENVKPQDKAKVDVVSDDEGSGPEEVPTVTSKNLSLNENLSEGKICNKRKLSDKRFNQERKRQNTSSDVILEKRDLTLLEKLLKKEIRHERNVILQCVHFVVKNNFFKT